MDQMEPSKQRSCWLLPSSSSTGHPLVFDQRTRGSRIKEVERHGGLRSPPRASRTVAALLAEALGCSFIEADDYHSQENKAKMSKGIPLSDADRTPWLESLQDAIRERLDGGENVAVSCSALRLKYREVIRAADRSYKPGDYATCRVKFVCLRTSAEVITERMQRRSSEGKHFMPASLLQSQLDLLKIDAAEGITEVDATVRAGNIVRDTVAQFREELASTVPPCF
ncbi:gluconokinase-like isoform X2 [Panicum virgatum]|uniref:gluconokinase-like isoform X2 n=1 Tax=Panicum virgatum TaxID=38727 RepID=UPI0019D55F11|nr:gluconokinase-like isoform X2 [Panicum virgatum]